MSSPVYCNLCNRNVIPRKKFNWLAAIFTVFFPYVLYFLIIKKKKCPICTGDNFGPARQNEMGK